MVEIFCGEHERIATLTTAEILELHEVLCDNYTLLPEMEPVSPPGVKNKDMLESAVSRQVVGSSNYYKYSDIYSNCATLVFGLVKNHAFHNGNKRIGFLAMIKHLYINGYVIRPNIQHIEIFELLRNLANSSLEQHADEYYKDFMKQNKLTKKSEWLDEVQVKYLAYWLRKNTEHKNTKIKQKTIPLKELEKLLKTKKLSTKFSGKFLTISKETNFLKELIGKKSYKKEYIIKDTSNVPLNLIEQIRRDFEISFLDGVDNSTFYNDEDIINLEITSYKKIIYKLAKT